MLSDLAKTDAMVRADSFRVRRRDRKTGRVNLMLPLSVARRKQQG